MDAALAQAIADNKMLGIELSDVPAKGSFLRGGNSIVSVGGPALASVANGAATGDQEFTIDEAAVLDRLVASEEDVSAYLTELKLNGDSLISGNVPLALFGNDNPFSPKFGHVVIQGDKLKFNISNASGAAKVFRLAFSAESVPVPDEPGRGSYLRKGRSLVAIGGPTPTSVAAATSNVEQVFSLTETGILGRLCIIQDQDWDDLVVQSIKYDNDELLTGEVPAALFRRHSMASPLFGQRVQPGHRLVIKYRNLHAADAASVLAAFSCM